MLLVEASEAMEMAAREALPGWIVARERMVPVPTTRPTPCQEPGVSSAINVRAPDAAPTRISSHN